MVAPSEPIQIEHDKSSAEVWISPRKAQETPQDEKQNGVQIQKNQPTERSRMILRRKTYQNLLDRIELLERRINHLSAEQTSMRNKLLVHTGKMIAPGSSDYPTTAPPVPEMVHTTDIVKLLLRKAGLKIVVVEKKSEPTLVRERYKV